MIYFSDIIILVKNAFILWSVLPFIKEVDIPNVVLLGIFVGIYEENNNYSWTLW